MTNLVDLENRLIPISKENFLTWSLDKLLKLDLPLLTERFPSFAFHSSGRNLGVVLDSTFTFSEHVANLTRSCYFHRRCLRAIRRSVSSHVFTSIVHAFVCSRIDYCNSLLVGLPKVRLSRIQSVLNAAAKLIDRLPRTSHISAFMFDHLHLLPLLPRIQLKVLTLICRSHIGQASRYLCDLICLPSSPISLHPLRSLDHHDLFVSQARTSGSDTSL